jgi:hypothetical protein
VAGRDAATRDAGGVPMILYCRLCSTGYGTTGEVPIRCPQCGRETRWGTSPPRTEPDPGWQLSVLDRRFLRSLRIGAD